ncbi:MAG: LysR family hydrogen peroxide-inducible transcriptional activator [Hyphomicrobiaceae bacterium]|jgi:LysR family hydrogen peroxide-inducible transcriptional activator
MNLPTLRQLEYLVAVADCLNFRRAAESCSVSQPGLSAQIRELEEQLGVRLFERDRRGVVATRAGVSLAVRAREILVATRELVQAAEVFEAPMQGDLRLGVIPTIAPYLLPKALALIRREYPRLRILLREEQTATLVEMVADARLDAALVAEETDLGNLETLELFEDPFLLCVPVGHPLALRTSVTQRDLKDLSVLLLEDGHCLRDQALSVCAGGGALEIGDFRASSLGTLVEMVATDIGVTLLPAMAARGLPPGVVGIPFAAPAPKRTVALAWRRTSARKETLRLLGDKFRCARPAAIVSPIAPSGGIADGQDPS